MQTTFLPERLAYLFHWVREREIARQNKEAREPKPWSTDPILQTTRFCNVKRMDDKVSRWLVDEWYPSQPNRLSKGQQLANVSMARLINWPDSLAVMRKAKLNTKWNRSVAIDVMRQIRVDSGKLFTGAYIINGLAGQDKVITVADQFEAMYASPKLVDNTSMEQTHKALQTLSGVGSFIAGQMVADLRHVWPGEWADRHAWAPLGPGSRRGIAWLLGWNGTDDLPSLKQSTFNEYMSELNKQFNRTVPTIMVHRRLEMHDEQNVLCEYDKYMRLLNGTGRAKNKFAGK